MGTERGYRVPVPKWASKPCIMGIDRGLILGPMVYVCLYCARTKRLSPHLILQGFRKLKYVDFSTSYSITGAFLKNLGGSVGGNLIEVLTLRDCIHLKEVEVGRLFSAVLAGDFKHLRHLDISNREGLASEGDWYRRCYSTSFIPFEQLVEGRPELCVVAEFPVDGSYVEVEQMIGSYANSDDTNSPSLSSSHTSDGSMFMSLSESSYNSDQSSGNEDSQDSMLAIYEESSDELDFVSG